MKKTILSIAFALTFVFMYANTSLDVKQINYQTELAPDGLCTVYIYNSSGQIVFMSMSIQPSASACETWARGKYWEFILNPDTGVD